jgi:hypothetical protein
MNARTPMLGVYPGLTNADYHALQGVNNSLLSSMHRSPAHAYALHIDPDRARRSPTPAMMAGTLAHCAILEYDDFGTRYHVAPTNAPKQPTKAQWSAKSPSADSLAAMSWWTDFNAHTGGAEVITIDQYALAQQQRSAVMSRSDLGLYFSSGTAEQSAFWIDKDTGLLCKCRPDWVHTLPDGRAIIVDVKTTQDAGSEEFSRSVWKFGYHRQAAWYSRGWAAASGQEVAGFVFAAVSSEHPVLAAAYMLDDESAAQGADECSELLALYAECKRTGKWPGYGGTVQLISLPKYARRELETEISYV